MSFPSFAEFLNCCDRARNNSMKFSEQSLLSIPLHWLEAKSRILHRSQEIRLLSKGNQKSGRRKFGSRRFVESPLSVPFHHRLDWDLTTPFLGRVREVQHFLETQDCSAIRIHGNRLGNDLIAGSVAEIFNDSWTALLRYISTGKLIHLKFVKLTDRCLVLW